TDSTYIADSGSRSSCGTYAAQPSMQSRCSRPCCAIAAASGRHVLAVVESHLVGDVDDAVGGVAEHVHLDPVVAVHMRDAAVHERQDHHVLVQHMGHLHAGAQGERD